MPRSRKYPIKLSEEEKVKLRQAASSHTTPSSVRIRAQVLLDVNANEGRTSETISNMAKKYGQHHSFVYKLKKKYLEKGLDAAVFEHQYSWIKWVVNLNKSDRQRLEQLLGSKDTSTHIKLKAHVLLIYDKVECRLSPNTVQDKVGYHIPYSTITHIRKTYVKKGLDAILLSSGTSRVRNTSPVMLTESQRWKLKQALLLNDTPSIVKRRAGILLDIDESSGQALSKLKDAAKKHELSYSTARNVKKRFLTKGLKAAVFEYPYEHSKWLVDLSKSDRQKLEQLLRQKNACPNAKLEARILLAYDKVDSRVTTIAAYNKIGRNVCPAKISRIKELYVKKGVDGIISLRRAGLKYPVVLSKTQKQELELIIRSSDTTPTVKKRADILLDLDESNGQTSRIIDLAKKYYTAPVAIIAIKKKYLQKGLDAVY